MHQLRRETDQPLYAVYPSDAFVTWPALTDMYQLRVAAVVYPYPLLLSRRVVYHISYIINHIGRQTQYPIGLGDT